MKNSNGLYGNLTNMYQVSKTIRMALEPIGKTKDNIVNMIDEDEQRAIEYRAAKKVIDDVHKKYMNDCLKDVTLKGLDEYHDLYASNGSMEKIDKIKACLRKQIANSMPKPPYFNKENIKKILECVDAKDRELLEKFKNFITYFSGYNKNRENIYTPDEIPTAIAYRLINDNLPKFINNIKLVKVSVEKIGRKELNKVISDNELTYFIGDINELTDISFFNKVLTQQGIDDYNRLIGGTSKENDVKIQGLNEVINLYNQRLTENDKKIGKMSLLYKQILSDKIGVSFIPEQFADDKEVVESINNFYEEFKDTVLNPGSSIIDLFNNISACNLSKIYINNDLSITDISQKLTGEWSFISNAINEEYDSIKKPKKFTDNYIEKRKKELKKIKTYSICELNAYLKNYKVEELLNEEIKTAIEDITVCYEAFKNYNLQKSIINDDVYVEIIKKLCDSIKGLQRVIKPLIVSDLDVDDTFYGELNTKWDLINKFTLLYNKVRNYMTQKPYSEEKFRLNFSISNFLNGWGQDYDTKRGHIFKHNNNYYLAIIDKKLSAEDVKSLYDEDGDTIHYRYIFQPVDNKNVPRKFIRSKGTNFAPSVEKYNLPINDIIKIYDNGEFKTDFRSKNPEKYKKSLIKLIDYFKLGFERDEDYKNFDLKWKESEEYNDIAEFYRDVEASCYKLEEEKVRFSELERLVEGNKLYLFKIYNKDFSEKSKGTPNLHTLYFKMLFDKDNIANTVYSLNGGAQMYFRKKSLSLEETTVHKANNPIERKNKENKGKKSLFVYDIIKNRRYTVDKFLLHISITANFKAKGREKIRETVNRYIKYNDDIYAIGIDRGERNLLYACVVDSNGDLVEQVGLNVIDGMDYHDLLETREKERKEERQSWKAIDNISNLKEGYLSLAIYKIVQLMLKYNAVLVLEDLNFGFKQGRQKFERSVYQKFEKMLITKLNYLVDKKADKEEFGGLLNALQLTDKFISFNKIGKQNGVIFYIPAWMTSKIDPVTGFTNLFYIKYESIDKSQNFFNKFDSIRYNEEKDYFEFEFDYNNFTTRAEGTKTKWTLCTYGDRIYTFRNKDANNKFDCEVLDLTKEFKTLFSDFNIKISNNMKEYILSVNSNKAKEFYQEMIKLFKLMVQLRNSSAKDNLDFILSPVMDEKGIFFDSRQCSSSLPQDADANGAYNIARKGLMYMDIIRKTEDKNLGNPKLVIKNKEWLDYVQKGSF